MNLAVPMMASTGQAVMHLVQPMQSCSTMSATCRGISMPLAGLSGKTSRPVKFAKVMTPAAPPGGHWLMGSLSKAMAWA